MDFIESLRQNPRPVVVDFWASWCIPCRSIEPALEKLDKEYTGRVDLWKVNADEHPELLRNLKVYGIPTLIAYKDGQEVARKTGAGSPHALSSLFDAAIRGETPGPPGLGLAERLIRLFAGLGLLGMAYLGRFTGLYLVLTVLGGLIAFSAVYDRCPIWQALAPRIARLYNR